MPNQVFTLNSGFYFIEEVNLSVHLIPCLRIMGVVFVC
jgi:hypothetical protein